MKLCKIFFTILVVIYIKITTSEKIRKSENIFVKDDKCIIFQEMNGKKYEKLTNEIVTKLFKKASNS